MGPKAVFATPFFHLPFNAFGSILAAFGTLLEAIGSFGDGLVSRSHPFATCWEVAHSHRQISVARSTSANLS